MSGEEPDDLGAIAAPPSLSSTPDPFTKEEAERADQRKLTPTEYIVGTFKKQVEDVCRQRDSLREQCDELQTKLYDQSHELRKDYDARIVEIRGRLDREVKTYRPECERLREAFGWSVVFNVVHTVLVTAGGALIGTASYFTRVGAPLMWGGIGLLASGILGLVVTATRGLITRKLSIADIEA